jgi:hypothetical protein
MELGTIFLAALAGFCLLHFLLVPRIEGTWAANRGIEKVAKLGAISTLKSARTVFQLAALIYGVLLLGVWLFGFGTHTSAGYLRILARLSEIRDLLSSAKSSLGILTSLLAMLGLGFLAYRYQRKDLQNSLAVTVQRETKRLEEQLEAGKWEAIPPTADMSIIIARIDELAGMVQRGAAYGQRLGEREVRAAIEAIESLQAELARRDFFRRMDLTTELEPPTTRLRGVWPRILTVLTSKGASADLGGLQKAASYGATILLCVSLVGVGAPAIAGTVEEAIDHDWDLQIKASSAEAKESWEKARSTQPENVPPSRSQATPVPTSRVLARVFVRSYLSSQAWKLPDTARKHADDIRSTLVRQNILHAADAPDIHAAHAARQPQATSSIDNAVDDLRRVVSEPDSLTALETRIAGQLDAERRSIDRGLWATIDAKVSKHLREYGTPMTSTELGKTLLGTVLDPAFDAAAPSLSNEFFKNAQKVLAKGLRTAVEHSIELQYNRFMVSLVGNDSLAQALNAVAATPLQAVGFTPAELTDVRDLTDTTASALEHLAAHLQAAPPTLRQASARVVGGKRITKLAEDLTTIREKDVKANDDTMDFLSEYDDYFAGNAAGHEATLRSQALRQAGLAEGEDAVGNIIRRSRDFQSLDVFQKVGGVVLGRTATRTDATPALMSLSWSFDPAGVALLVTDTSGHEIRLGTFATDIVYRALLFAADDRPMAVTVINTQLGRQKVIAHPALVDTTMGCELIELDSIVFSYINRETRKTDEREMDRVRHIHDLYRLAKTAARIPYLEQEEDRRRSVGELFQLMAEDPPGLKSALRDTTIFSDPERSPLAAKLPVYDGSVLRVMSGCIERDKPDLLAFTVCVTKAVKDAGYDRGLARASSTPSKKLDYVSGVRDREFTLDAPLSFLRPPNDSQTADPLYPLTFSIHDTTDDPSREKGIWTFPTLDDGIKRAVQQLRASNAIARTIIEDSKAFAVLQRLFRLAFHGQLGEAFPVERLSELAAATKARSNDATSTVRWVQRQRNPERMFATLLQRAIARAAAAEKARPSRSNAEAETAMLQRLKGCASSIGRSGSQAFTASGWPAACQISEPDSDTKGRCDSGGGDAEAACALLNIVEFVRGLGLQIQLAEQLGLPSDSKAEPRDAPLSCR